MTDNIKKYNKNKGDLGEYLVYKYLDKYNCEILSKNFRCHFGEIDIIFKDKNEIVFAEIKTRNSLKYGRPAESVTNFKMEHITSVAKYFLYINHLSSEFIRFDVIEVYLNANKPIINHIRNAFW